MKKGQNQMQVATSGLSMKKGQNRLQVATSGLSSQAETSPLEIRFLKGTPALEG